MRTNDGARLVGSPNPRISATSQITTRGPGCYWDYTDVCAFFFCVVILGTLLRLAVVFHLLSALSIQQPTILVQAVVSLCILLALYAILKFRHGGAVWRALGWTLPSYRWVLAVSLGGMLLAAGVTLVARSSGIPTVSLTAWKIAVLAATVGPALEESFFRGCLLPLVARTSGSPVAVISTALLFSFFHQPPTLLHCACFAVSGIAYGWVRVASRSTTAAALMHAAYNLTLFACQTL